MKTLDKHNVVCFDVDGTLVDSILFGAMPKGDEDMIDISSPFSRTSLAFIVKTPIVNKVKQHHLQGHYVIVWSQAGHEWAETVIKALGLEESVDLLMTKPKWAYDDLPIEEWLTRIVP